MNNREIEESLRKEAELYTPDVSVDPAMARGSGGEGGE